MGIRELFLLISVFLIAHIGKSQFYIHGSYNIDVYKPFTKAAQEYEQINDQVFSRTFFIGAHYRVQKKENRAFTYGLEYRNILHTVKEKIRYIPQYEISGGQIVDTYYIYYPLDLVSKSFSLGFTSSYERTIGKSIKLNDWYGIEAQWYFYEKYKSSYYHGNGNYSDEIQPSFILRYIGFIGVSTFNTSIYYRFLLPLGAGVQLGAKINLGTNLYSDWDQFKRYAWLGVGLELGFGKAKKKE